MAASNVVRLPTAAPRKVENYRFAEQRRACLEARKAWPGEYRSPVDRKADKLAAEIRDIQQTPALIAVSAILASLDAETYEKVMRQLAPAALGGNVPMRQALATAQASRLDFGDQYYLLKALDRLNAEGK